jgi:hypothetical protein
MVTPWDRFAVAHADEVPVGTGITGRVVAAAAGAGDVAVVARAAGETAGVTGVLFTGGVIVVQPAHRRIPARSRRIYPAALRELSSESISAQ